MRQSGIGILIPNNEIIEIESDSQRRPSPTASFELARFITSIDDFAFIYWLNTD
jgi:hypothetical protein